MNYAWARDYALELINQYSIAGDDIAATYNNQSDYLLRIPKLVDDAQYHIATTTGKIREVVALSELEHFEKPEWTEYKLPWNCWSPGSAGIVRYNEGRLQRFHRYHAVGKDRVAVPKGLEGGLYLEYFRIPGKIGNDPPETAELDNTEAAQMAVPFYVAAHLVMQDNAFAYQALYNEFNDKLTLLLSPPTTELTVVEDSYSAGEWDADGWGCY